MSRYKTIFVISIIFISFFKITSINAQGWHWDNPYPQGNTLYSVWGSSATDIFAVGECGTIIHYDGTNWTVMYSTTYNNLCGIWGYSSGELYAVGWGTILRYTDRKWSEIYSIPGKIVNVVWGSTPDNIYAAGDVIWYYNGISWSETTIPWIYEIYGI